MKYTAAAVGEGFWYIEFDKILDYKKKGYQDQELRRLQEEENILNMRSKSMSNKAIGETIKRVNILPKGIINIYDDLSLNNKKLVNFIAIMMTDRLLFELVYEVYREKLRIGDDLFDINVVEIFIRNKSELETEVSSYKEVTKRRLAGAYKTCMSEAGLLDENKPVKVLLDHDLASELKTEEMNKYYRALTGE